MGIEILTQRQKVEEVSYKLSFTYKENPNAGFSFDCDAKGNVAKLAQPAVDSFNRCTANVNGEFNEPEVVETVARWTKPATGKCYCGQMVELDHSLDNLCSGCGTCFNMNGQEVVPSWRCDEQGEPYDYDYYDE
jgi:hypothetical protein